MASRSHVIHDYRFGGSPTRSRREVWYPDEDPVVLPRSSSWSVSGGLIAAALTASALIAASVLSISYRDAPPQLAETPTAPLEREWQPDSQVAQANVVQALNHRALSVPSAVSVANLPLEADTPSDGGRVRSTPSRRESHQYPIDDSAPGAQERFPQPPQSKPLVPETPVLPVDLPQAPYPNPTMTPPEGVAPSDAAPETPTPELERENPYR
jgi:hypothetical protein